jgi:hypothetical protein
MVASRHFENAIHLHTCIGWQIGNADRGPGVTPAFAEQRKHQIGRAVDDFRDVRIVGLCQDETAEPVTADHTIQISIERKAERRQEVERAKFCGFLTGGEIMHLADPAGIANHAIPLANLAGKEHKRSRAGKGFERSTRLRHWRQFEAKRGKALRNDPAHDDAPSIAAAG